MDLYYKRKEIEDYIDDKVKEYEDYDPKRLLELIRDGDLHNEWFNTDYYLAYYSEANEWLGDKAFEIIGIVKEYEEDMFGEVTTDLSDSTAVVNMYVYILGEDIMSDDKRFDRDWAEKELET